MEMKVICGAVRFDDPGTNGQPEAKALSGRKRALSIRWKRSEV